MSDPIRSRRARDLAERALVRLVRVYGDVPEFVLLGGLVPDLLCRTAARPHQGTTDVDVQVDLEIQSGSVNSERLERALKDCGFTSDPQRVWRWRDETRRSRGWLSRPNFLQTWTTSPTTRSCRSTAASRLARSTSAVLVSRRRIGRCAQSRRPLVVGWRRCNCASLQCRRISWRRHMLLKVETFPKTGTTSLSFFYIMMRAGRPKRLRDPLRKETRVSEREVETKCLIEFSH